MTSDSQTLIAGEPAANLAEGLSQIAINRENDGTVSVNAKLDGEVGASLLRAVERYGADLVTANRLHDVEKRQADAFIRIVEELAELAGVEGAS
jgi:hypothetical protein